MSDNESIVTVLRDDFGFTIENVHSTHVGDFVIVPLGERARAVVVLGNRGDAEVQLHVDDERASSAFVARNTDAIACELARCRERSTNESAHVTDRERL